MNDNTTEMVREALTKIRGNVDDFCTKQKERLGEFTDKQLELQARLSELEQKAARRGGDGGGTSYGAGNFHSALGKAAEDIAAGMKEATSTRLALPLSLKVMAAAITSTTYAPPAENAGPVSVYHPLIARLIDLLPSRPVTGNSLTYTRISYATDSPPGNQAAIVPETQTKPSSSILTVPVTVTMKTFAHWVDASKQVLDDVTELQGILDGILRGGLLDVVDADIFSVLTTGGNFTAFTPTASETIGDGVARIAAQIANQGGTNIVVALNPVNYLTMQLTKASTSGTYLGMPPNLASRVVAAPAVTAGKLLAFAPTTGASWADREGVSVQVGLKADDFIKNMVTALCESRGETLIRDPAHVAYGNATA